MSELLMVLVVGLPLLVGYAFLAQDSCPISAVIVALVKGLYRVSRFTLVGALLAVILLEEFVITAAGILVGGAVVAGYEAITGDERLPRRAACNFGSFLETVADIRYGCWQVFCTVTCDLVR